MEEIYFAGLRKTKKFQKNFSELPRQRGEKTPYIGEEVKGSWKSIDICRTKRGGDEDRQAAMGERNALSHRNAGKGEGRNYFMTEEGQREFEAWRAERQSQRNTQFNSRKSDWPYTDTDNR